MADTSKSSGAVWGSGDAPVLVTGGGGFIGRQVVRALADAGATPRALVRSPGAAGGLRALGAEVARGTLARPGPALDGVRTVFHFAYDLRSSGADNLDQFSAFLRACTQAGVRQLVHASSIVVHDGWPHEDLSETAPITPAPADHGYRTAKIAMERMIGEAVTSGQLEAAVILRPTLVYGPGSRLWTLNTVDRLRAGTVLLPEPPHGHAEGKPFGLCHCLHVADLAEAAVRAAADPMEGLRTYLLSDPNPPTWQEYYAAHARVIGAGAVRMVPHDELSARLPPAQEATGAGGPGLAARVSAQVRRLIGNSAVDAVGARLRALRRPAAGGEQVPDRFLFELYCTAGRIDVSRARDELGFAPGAGLAERLEEMADELRQAG